MSDILREDVQQLAEKILSMEHDGTWAKVVQDLETLIGGNMSELIPNHMIPTYRAVAAHIGAAFMTSFDQDLKLAAKILPIVRGQISGLILGLATYAYVEHLQKSREAEMREGK